MDASDYLAKYAEGWSNGDVDTVMGTLADDYLMHDPNAGEITKSGFEAYMNGTKEAAAAASGGASNGPLMELSEVVTQERDGVLTAWCWWEIPGTPMKGGGLIKATSSGVTSERLTYFTKLPE
jgi:hypothetical protein